MTQTAQAAFLELAQKFDKAAADADESSPTYRGYRLAMEHAAERTRQAAADAEGDAHSFAERLEHAEAALAGDKA